MNEEEIFWWKPKTCAHWKYSNIRSLVQYFCLPSFHHPLRCWMHSDHQIDAYMWFWWRWQNSEIFIVNRIGVSAFLWFWSLSCQLPSARMLRHWEKTKAYRPWLWYVSGTKSARKLIIIAIAIVKNFSPEKSFHLFFIFRANYVLATFNSYRLYFTLYNMWSFHQTYYIVHTAYSIRAHCSSYSYAIFLFKHTQTHTCTFSKLVDKVAKEPNLIKYILYYVACKDVS